MELDADLLPGDIVPPVPNGKDFLAGVPHCVPVNTPVCDWADFRLCPIGLAAVILAGAFFYLQ